MAGVVTRCRFRSRGRSQRQRAVRGEPRRRRPRLASSRITPRHAAPRCCAVLCFALSSLPPRLPRGRRRRPPAPRPRRVGWPGAQNLVASARLVARARAHSVTGGHRGGSRPPRLVPPRAAGSRAAGERCDLQLCELRGGGARTGAPRAPRGTRGAAERAGGEKRGLGAPRGGRSGAGACRSARGGGTRGGMPRTSCHRKCTSCVLCRLSARCCGGCGVRRCIVRVRPTTGGRGRRALWTRRSWRG